MGKVSNYAIWKAFLTRHRGIKPRVFEYHVPYLDRESGKVRHKTIDSYEPMSYTQFKYITVLINRNEL